MATFDIILKGLHDDRMRLSALQKLQSEFQIDLAVGTLMLATTPTTVKRVMSLEEAEAYYYALTDIGFEIEMRKDDSLASPTLVGHDDPKERKRSLTRGLTLLLDFDLKRSMQEAIVRALLLPLRGSGIAWHITSAIVGFMTVGIGSALLSMFSSDFAAALSWVGFLFVGLIGGVLTGVLASFLRQCFWGVVNGETTPQRMHEIGPEFLKNEIGVAGSIYFFSLVAWQLLALGWLISTVPEHGFAHAFAHPVTMLLVLGGFLYWPLGLTLAASQTNPGAFWSLPRAMELLKDAPLQTLAICIGGAALVTCSWFALAALSMVSSGAFWAGVFALFGPVLAYVHGVQGALLGIVFKAFPDALD